MAYTQDTPPDNHGAPGAAGEKISPELAEAISIGYEPHDVALRGIFIFILSLMFISLVVLGAMYVIMMGFVKYDRGGDPINSPVAIEHVQPPQPLQPSWNHNRIDQEDMRLMREQTYAQLHSTGISPTGRRYIPIETAMDQVLPQLPIHAAVQPAGEGSAR
jgi:hypothetical protein